MSTPFILPLLLLLFAGSSDTPQVGNSQLDPRMHSRAPMLLPGRRTQEGSTVATPPTLIRRHEVVLENRSAYGKAPGGAPTQHRESGTQYSILKGEKEKKKNQK